MSKFLMLMLGLIFLAGCLGQETNMTVSSGDASDSDYGEEYGGDYGGELASEHTTLKFTEGLVAGDFTKAWNTLSPKLKAEMTVEQLQSRWREATSAMGNGIQIAEPDVGALPDTPEQYGIQTSVPRKDWVAWEFASFGNENGLLEVRALVVKQDGTKVIEHFEIGEAD